MIGRGAYGRPWFLNQAIHYLRTGERLPDPSLAEQYATVRAHFEAMLEHYGLETGVRMARKHLGWYSKGLPASAEFRGAVNRETDPAKVRAHAGRILPARPRTAGGLTCRCARSSAPARRAISFPRRSSIRSRRRSSWSMPAGSSTTPISPPSSSSASAAPAWSAIRWTSSCPRTRRSSRCSSRCRRRGGAVAENGITLASPRIGNRFCALRLSPIVDSDGLIAVSLVEQTIARNIDRQMSHRSAARSVSALAAMLAHEVKNPLSGIRGAAQLLEQSVPDTDRELTSLICEETDRIVALVDRMEAFADGRPIDRGPINIHQVLNHVRRLPQNGFGKGVRFIETYDPSLPDVHGDRDQLIQVFLNLVKNACEAPGDGEREIELSTAYRHGLRLAVPGQQARVNLPLVVSVRDNGRGVSRRDPRPPVRRLRDQQADRNRPGSCIGGQDHQRPRRGHRIRQRARPHNIPGDVAACRFPQAAP